MKKILIPIVIFAATSNALAGSYSDTATVNTYKSPDANYWYFGAQAGVHDFAGDFNNFDTFTARAILGYQFHPHFAVEANLVGYDDVNSFISFKDSSGDVYGRYTTKHQISPELDLLLKASTKFNDIFGIYGKLGVGIWHDEVKLKYVQTNSIYGVTDVYKASHDDTNVDLVGAVGLTLHANENFAVDASITANYNEDYKDRYTLGVGFTYNIL